MDVKCNNIHVKARFSGGEDAIQMMSEGADSNSAAPGNAGQNDMGQNTDLASQKQWLTNEIARLKRYIDRKFEQERNQKRP